MSLPDPRFLPALAELSRQFVAFARWRGAAAFAAMIGGALLEGVGLAMLVPLLAVIAGQGSGAVQAGSDRAFGSIGVEGQLPRLAVLLAIFVALVLLRALVLGWRDRSLARLQVGFIERQRSGLLTALADARWSDIAGLRHARVLHALDDNIERTAAATQVTLQLVTSAVMLSVQWLLVALLAPAMALLTLVLMALGAALLVPVMRRASRLGHSLAGGRLQLFDGAAQLLGGLKLAMAQNLQHAFVAEFAQTAQALNDQRLEFMHRFSRSRLTGTTVGALAGAAVVLAGVWYGTPVPALIAAVAVFTRMIGPATTIQQIAQQITGYLPGFVALQALRHDLASKAAPPAAAVPLPPRASVRFEAVGYRHGETGVGIADVTLTIRPGEIVGVVGPSGAGKTTFVDVLAGLLEPQAGAVLVGDLPLAVAARGWRDRIAYVGQDSYLFNDSVRRNLTLGIATRTEAELWNALDRVGARTLVEATPLGLDTPVAERGARLSGGQRQRIALARALLRRPELIILDEATNAIDVAGEAAILAVLAALDPRPTIVVVAHRTETLAWCGRLLRFEAGRLIAD